MGFQLMWRPQVIRANSQAVRDAQSCGRIALGLVTALLAPFGVFARTADLPTTAHVYFVRQQAGLRILEPASDVLVLAERINVCDRSKWSVGEASSTGVDSYLVRTAKDGAFHIQPRRYDQVCTRVVLKSTAYVPGYESVVARAYFATHADSTNPAYARMDKDNDVLLWRGRPISDSSAVVGFDPSFGSEVTLPMIRQIYTEMRPDLETLLAMSVGGKESSPSRELRMGWQETYLLADWKTMKAKQQVQLIDLMINDYRFYNLKAKPAQSAQYYSDELRQIAEHYRASAIPKMLAQSTIFELLEALATLDGDWRHNWFGPPESLLGYAKRILGSNFDELRDVFPEKYERLEHPEK
jgi:hypothetical protein